MEQLGHGTNTPYLVDFIKITLSAKLANPQEIRSLYVDQGLSASQIASQLCIAKSVVLARLHALGIQSNTTTRKYNTPDNFRCPVAPYGYAVKDGKLVPYKKELRVCHIIVEMVERKGLTFRAVARNLQTRGVKNRAGRTSWSHGSVVTIYNKWKGKI